MLARKKIAVIGAGHIGSALIGGMLNAKLAAPGQIVATRRSAAARDELKKKWGIAATGDNRKAAAKADILLIAVKPQNAREVLEDLAPAVTTRHLLVSVMAGITTSTIQAWLGKEVPVVRAMPNTPVLVDAGATPIAKSADAADTHLRLAESIFRAVGTVEVVPERFMDAVTGLSGSGPVYVFMMIEALTDGGVKVGLPRAIAARLAAQTVFGAAKLVIATGKHPAILKDDVTTPAGTAIEAIHELESRGLRSDLMHAVIAATRRSEELSRTLK
ncbi:MAG: pyrroline-5-carboxylate reductase [Elusimicrobiota bacterium]